MALTLGQGLLILIVGFICSIDQQTEAFYWFRPMVCTFFTGIILGNPILGVQCGVVTELAYLGMTNVGGTVPPDPLFAGVMTVVLAYTTGQSPEAALGLSYPFALLAQAVGILFNTMYSFVPERLDVCAKEGDVKKFNSTVIAATLFKSVVVAFLLFLCSYALQGPIQVFVNSFPQWVIHGLEVAGGILPAVGLSMLLLTTLKPETYPYLALGFIMATFLTMPNVLPVAIAGAALAYIDYSHQKKLDDAVANAQLNDGGDIDGI